MHLTILRFAADKIALNATSTCVCYKSTGHTKIYPAKSRKTLPILQTLNACNLSNFIYVFLDFSLTTKSLVRFFGCMATSWILESFAPALTQLFYDSDLSVCPQYDDAAEKECIDSCSSSIRISNLFSKCNSTKTV